MAKQCEVTVAGFGEVIAAALSAGAETIRTKFAWVRWRRRLVERSERLCFPGDARLPQPF